MKSRPTIKVTLIGVSGPFSDRIRCNQLTDELINPETQVLYNVVWLGLEGHRCSSGSLFTDGINTWVCARRDSDYVSHQLLTLHHLSKEIEEAIINYSKENIDAYK